MLNITIADVKRKARIRETTYDADIQALLDESQIVVEGQLADYDGTDATAVATVRLGVLEVLAGMALKEHANEEDQDDVSIGPLKIGETKQSQTRLQRGKELEAQGWERLAPYLKTNQSTTNTGGFFSFEVM